MAEVSTKPWGSIGESDYADAADFCSACLIDLNESGAEKTKARCKLPVREPKSMGGKLNANGMRAAAAVLAGARGGVDAPPEQKRAAARKLAGMMRSADMEPPESMRRMMQS
ncbi:MAG: hypothetical protein HY690_16745 [Chloroflexi bacterium]|nr:hypothetical protein [Chloroflexota bacterium]